MDMNIVKIAIILKKNKMSNKRIQPRVLKENVKILDKMARKKSSSGKKFYQTEAGIKRRKEM